MGKLARKILDNPKILPRRIKFSREGKFYLLITLGVGFAAINTGNNLLYLLLGMLLALIILSGILSEISVRKIEVKRENIFETFAKRKSNFEYTVFNRSSIFPSYSIGVTENFGIKGVKQIIKPAIYIKPGGKSSVMLSVMFPTRGIYKSNGINIETEFPFSFFKKIRFFRNEYDFLVYPRLLSDVQLKTEKSKNIESESRVHDRRTYSGDELYGVKEYTGGEPLINISWKHTAKRGKFVLKEFLDTLKHDLNILLINASKDRERVEFLISKAATICEKFNNYELTTIVTIDSILSGTPFISGRRNILFHLATLKIHDSFNKAMVSNFMKSHKLNFLILSDEKTEII